MRKGISPVIAVVLLIAISVIAAVGVWYWVAELAGQPAGLDHDQMAVSVEECNAETTENALRIRNTGGVNIDDGTEAEIHPHDNATVDIGLNATEVAYRNLDGGDGLDTGTEYTLLADEIPAVTFTCN